MSSLVVLLLLFSFFSLHACHARVCHLGFNDIFVKDLVQDSQKAELDHEASIPSKMRSSVSENKVQVGSTLRIIPGSSFGAKTLSHGNSYVYSNKGSPKEGAPGCAGTEFAAVLSIKEHLNQVTKLEGMERPKRSMLGSAAHQNDKEVVDANDFNLEDMTEMDYAQPHRKPPIHNKKP